MASSAAVIGGADRSLSAFSRSRSRAQDRLRTLALARPLDQYPAGETRLATYPQSRSLTPWDGKTADIPCWVRHIDGDISGLRHQLRASGLSGPLVSAIGPVHVPLSRRRLLRDGSRASGPPERGLFEYPYKVEDGKLLIKAGEMPTPGSPTALNSHPGESRTMRLIPQAHRRMARRAPADRPAPFAKPLEHPRSTRNGELVLRLRQRRARRLHPADRYRHSCWPWSTCLPPAKPGTACRFSITTSPSAGSSALCMAGDRTSWWPSC